MPPSVSGGVKEPCTEAKRSWAPLKAACVATRRLQWQKRLCTFEKGVRQCFLSDVHVGEYDFLYSLCFVMDLMIYSWNVIFSAHLHPRIHNFFVWTSYKVCFFFFFSHQGYSKTPTAAFRRFSCGSIPWCKYLHLLQNWKQDSSINISKNQMLRKHIANTPEKEKRSPRHFNMKIVSLQRDNLTLYD